MMAYPMQRMSAFQQQGSQPQFFGLCLRVRFQSLLHAALGHVTFFISNCGMYCQSNVAVVAYVPVAAVVTQLLLSTLTQQ